MNVALILAGGQSERAPGLGVPKQFFEVENRPLISYSLARFQNCGPVSHIAIVAPEDWQTPLASWLQTENITKFLQFVPPGRTRQHSILNGLSALRQVLSGTDLVVIHDAARPMVTTQDISRCIEAATGYDGATPAVPVNDTIYQSMDGAHIHALLQRDQLFAGQTPECYRFGAYMEAHSALTDEEIAGIRGSSEIAFKAGMNVHLFPGNARNLKITSPADIEYFRYMMERNTQQ